MKRVLLGGLGVAVALLVAACGGEPSQTHNVQIDVGGSVSYALDPSEGLAGVVITLTDVDGNVRIGTTNSAGLWTIENVLPGVYAETYELAGYETVESTFSIPAGGENNVKNVFITRAAVYLSETPLTMTVSPFSATLRPADPMYDGLGGVTMVYSTSGNADVVVTFSRRVINGNVRIIDGLTGQQAFATADTTRTIWTISEAQISNINGGITPANPGIRTDQDSFTWSRLMIQTVTSYTPIHGDVVATPLTDGYFNVVP